MEKSPWLTACQSNMLFFSILICGVPMYLLPTVRAKAFPHRISYLANEWVEVFQFNCQLCIVCGFGNLGLFRGTIEEYISAGWTSHSKCFEWISPCNSAEVIFYQSQWSRRSLLDFLPFPMLGDSSFTCFEPKMLGTSTDAAQKFVTCAKTLMPENLGLLFKVLRALFGISTVVLVVGPHYRYI